MQVRILLEQTKFVKIYPGLLLTSTRPNSCSVIGNDLRLRKVRSILVSVCGTEVDGVESFKYLGVVLSSNFTWSEHVQHVISKLNQRLGLLRRIKHLHLVHAFFTTKVPSFPS